MYCMLEMESPNCKLPWNDALTTNSEAAEGWSPEQLNVMAQKKQDMWDQLCEQVREGGGQRRQEQRGKGETRNGGTMHACMHCRC